MLLIWYTFLIVISIANLINWLSSLPFEARKRFIARRLELADIEFKAVDYQEELEQFVRDYIKMDGIFVLKMLTIHAGILVCTEIVDDMWEEYREKSSIFKGIEEKRPILTDGDTTVIDMNIENFQPADSASLCPTLTKKTRRKTSVLVPLVTARPSFNTTEYSNMEYTSTPRSMSALLYSSATSNTTATAFLNAPSVSMRNDVYLRKPSAQQYRAERRARTGLTFPSIKVCGIGNASHSASTNTLVGMYSSAMPVRKNSDFSSEKNFEILKVLGENNETSNLLKQTDDDVEASDEESCSDNDQIHPLNSNFASFFRKK